MIGFNPPLLSSIPDSQNTFINLSEVSIHPNLNEGAKILGALVELNHLESSTISQMVVIPDSKFMTDDGGGAAAENHIFLMNATDYLLGDKDLISLRSREITNRPLEELEDAEKNRWKWINILFPSALVVGFGFLRLKRENKRARLLEELYD